MFISRPRFSTFPTITITRISSLTAIALIVSSSPIKSHLDKMLIAQSRTWFVSVTLSIAY